MRSKNKKRKAAYRRGEKLANFFQRATIAMCGVVLAAGIVLGIKMLTQTFRVQEVLVSGNYHLGKEDIIRSAGIKRGEPLFALAFEDIDEQLKQNAWIKTVALKKQFPDTLVIKVKEAVPAALLSIKKRLYLVDEEGVMLERINADTMPFLPVIKNINPKNKKGIAEALKLIHALSEKKLILNRESIEIGLESYGLTMNVDGEFIKVGYGNYAEKFNRWIELEPAIRKRGVPIKYVDLRFKESVIVKPLKVNKGGSS